LQLQLLWLRRVGQAAHHAEQLPSTQLQNPAESLLSLLLLPLLHCSLCWLRHVAPGSRVACAAEVCLCHVLLLLLKATLGLWLHCQTAQVYPLQLL
jgi:hypothetical protein